MTEVFDSLCIALAFIMGLLMRPLRLPPLIGFLAAGFLLRGFTDALSIPDQAGPILSYVSHTGVLLLLFTIGLKLRVKPLLQTHVLGVSVIHFVLVTAITTLALLVTMELDLRATLLIAVALSFSSTVFAAKVLESKRELGSFHGRIAIGILILQDLLALLTLTIATTSRPSPYAALLLLLPFLRPLLYGLLNLAGHDELLVLLGVLLSVGIGGAGFHLLGLSSELGALSMGVLVGRHPRAKELSEALFSIKEIFLVGFFLQIGMSGLPTLDDWKFAGAVALLLPVKAILFVLLLTRFRLRGRNAFLAGLSLATFSEFGLIVAHLLMPEWLVPLALSTAFSFLLAAPLNRFSHQWAERLSPVLLPLETGEGHPDEQPVRFDRARILIFGMGRTGTAAYSHLEPHEPRIVGIDADPVVVERHVKMGRDVHYADAEDAGFWSGVQLSGVQAVVLAIQDFESKLIACKKLRALGYPGLIVAHTLYEDESRRINDAGANKTYLTMTGAGIGLGEHVRQHLCDATPPGSIGHSED